MTARKQERADERGMLLIEALVAMMIVAVAVGSYFFICAWNLLSRVRRIWFC